jgi:hypothetical protein
MFDNNLGEGVFANNKLTLNAKTLILASSYVTIDDNAYYGNTYAPTASTPWKFLGIKFGGYITIGGITKKMDSSTGSVPEVALPEPDFDWYRAQAKIQDLHAYGDDGQHYYGTGDLTNGTKVLGTVDIQNTDNLYNGWICFCEGNLTINNTTLKPNTKGVFVAMGDVTINSGWWLQGNTEYQVIATGKVTYKSGLDASLNPTDTIFIYSGYESKTDTDYAVTYQLNWFRDIKGQITAKGSIYTPDGNWGLIQDVGITYKRPSVPVAGFPMPFTVKSWKVIE